MSRGLVNLGIVFFGATVAWFYFSDLFDKMGRSLGLIGIDERKAERLADAFRDYARVAQRAVRYELSLGHADLTDLVAMGPNARHIGPDDLAGRVAALPEPVTVTVDAEVRGYRDTSTTELSTCRRIMGA